MEFENSQFDDERLDEALKQYSAAEPRAGLESRILANLASERERLNGRRWHWHWIAATLAFGIAVLVGSFLTRKPDYQRANVLNEAPITKGSQGMTPHGPSDYKTVVALRPTNHGKSQRPIEPARTEPRFEQFPSPRPLNEQEEMLARYVREWRPQAVMVARARAELLKRELAGFLEESPSSGQTRDLQQ
jgi:hypothetical protein